MGKFWYDKPPVPIPDFVEVNGTPGPDTLFGGLALIGSHIHAGDGSDRVFAGSGEDTVWGERGVDEVHGGNGNDTLYGGDEGDFLFGEAGNDQIHGDAGIDFIVGGMDVDQLWGGTDADHFIWNRAFETGIPGSQLPLDIIWDFNPLEGDKIDVRNLAQDVGFGVQHLTFVTGLFTGAMGEVRCEQDPSHPQDVNVLIHFSELNADAGITVHTTGNFTPDLSWFDL